MAEFNPKPYEKIGARAYMAGEIENPYDPGTKEHQSWTDGFTEEKNFWEKPVKEIWGAAQ